MLRRTMESLGTLVKAKRGDKKLREAAKEIGIGPATLMRVENGRTPDIGTFGKICKWLEIDPKEFLGGEPTKSKNPELLVVSAHFRADKNPEPKTVNALAQMILLAARIQPKMTDLGEDGI